MPVGLRTPAERLSASHSAFAKIKGSLDAPMAALLVAANAKLPQAIGQQVGRDLFSRHSIVFSNVPGPAEPIVIGGKTLVGLQAAYPNLIPQLICVSYNQRMHMNIVVDETIVPQPELLASLYIDELRARRPLRRRPRRRVARAAAPAARLRHAAVGHDAAPLGADAADHVDVAERPARAAAASPCTESTGCPKAYECLI